MKTLNQELRTQVKRETAAWKKKHPNTSVPLTGKELQSYSQFPAPDSAFSNFGLPYKYTKGWDHKSRATAIMIPRSASEEQLLDHGKMGGTYHKSSGKHIVPKTRKIEPVVAGSSHMDVTNDLNMNLEKYPLVARAHPHP